jgi:hypothetical protein
MVRLFPELLACFEILTHFGRLVHAPINPRYVPQ